MSPVVKRIIQFHQVFSSFGPDCKATHLLYNEETFFLAKPLFVIQPLSLHLVHPQGLWKEAEQMYLEKEEDVI